MLQNFREFRESEIWACKINFAKLGVRNFAKFWPPKTIKLARFWLIFEIDLSLVIAISWISIKYLFIFELCDNLIKSSSSNQTIYVTKLHTLVLLIIVPVRLFILWQKWAKIGQNLAILCNKRPKLQRCMLLLEAVRLLEELE